MGAFKKVALLGKGRLGSAILQQLVDNGFAVTVLSRDPSAIKDLPSGAEAKQVDYSSHDSLVEALRGNDVAISTFSFTARVDQEVVIEACIKAGVKRYVPDDWGSVSTDPKAQSLPMYHAVVKVQESLKQKADEGLIEYTIFSVGAFLDILLDLPLILDVKKGFIRMFDDGQHPFSSTSLESIGKAVAGALKAPEATKNRNLLIHDFVLTQVKVLAIAKKYSSQTLQWTEARVNAQQELEQAFENVKKNPSNHALVLPLVQAVLLSGKYRGAYPAVDNALVGLPLLTDEELERKLASKLQRDD
ncbi:nmrA-like family protein [Sarocladium implicatum]|nr:nmrA-like family protein [Sarocladium implicatum]